MPVRSAKRAERVVVVSNRLPITLSRTRDMHHKLTRSSGGLISAIEPLYKKHNLVWIGSLGPGAGRGTQTQKLLKKVRDFTYVTVDVDRREWQGYYNGFSNKALWPLLHYFNAFCQFDEKQWEMYRHVNHKFAEKIIRTYHKKDLIWIHDYHLMLVPQIVRNKLPESRIGFYLHTPFPSSELFRVFPWRNEVLEGLLGADLLGFHTYDYLRHFRSSILRILGIECEMAGARYQGRHISMEAIPVGADVDRIEELSKNVKVKKSFATLKKTTGKLKILLGVDRLDYTKGIVDRLEAYELFLEEHPEWRGKVEFFQVLVPSRIEVDSYLNLKLSIDALAGRVNAQYGKPDWTPIRCFYRQLVMEDLVNYYANADVAVVTPLRDGMNLVCKEFVLAQHPDTPGALILSEFCGAASELSDAIIVNPSNKKEVADAMKTALEMKPEEVKRRYESMYKVLKVYSAENWGQRFIQSLKAISRKKKIERPFLDRPTRNKIKSQWKKASRRLLLLDYDGSLTDIVSLPKHAMPTSTILRLLRQLTADKKNLVMIVSGRSRDVLEEWLMKTGAYLCAEHGAWVWDTQKWRRTVNHVNPDWKKQVRPVMQVYTERTAGSFIEEKEEALAWHYRLSEPDYGAWQANNLAFNLESLLQNLPLQCLMGKKVVEVRHREVHKGIAWRWTRKAKGNFDFVLAIGDDRTDEDLFAALPDKAYTIRVGLAESVAKFRLSSPTDVRKFLKSLL